MAKSKKKVAPKKKVAAKKVAVGGQGRQKKKKA